jgi:hypothetical protein
MFNFMFNNLKFELQLHEHVRYKRTDAVQMCRQLRVCTRSLLAFADAF